MQETAKFIIFVLKIVMFLDCVLVEMFNQRLSTVNIKERKQQWL